MADFSHLKNTMADQRGENKEKKKKAKEEKAGVKRVSKKLGASKTTPAAISNRMGGGMGDRLDKAKNSDKKPGMFAKEQEEYGKGKSKIWLALNPQRLHKETGREKADREDDDNVVVIEVRGSGQLGSFAMEDRQGAWGADASDEEDVDTSNLPDFGEFQGEMNKMRAQREKEGEERRQALRRSSLADKAKKDKELQKEIDKITAFEKKKEAKEGMSDKEVKKVQERLANELTFDFGFDEEEPGGFGFAADADAPAAQKSSTSKKKKK